jgi:hypothetical protein
MHAVEWELQRAMQPEEHLLARLLCALTLDALQLRQQRCLFL